MISFNHIYSYIPNSTGTQTCSFPIYKTCYPPQSLNPNLIIMKRRGSSSLSPRELMEDVHDHDLKKQQLEDLRTHTEEQRKEEVYPPWSDLHVSILQIIFSQLSGGDDKKFFRRICSSWRQVEEDRTPDFQLPLITYQETTDNTHTFRSIHGKSRKVDLPGTYASTLICASAFGWLLMVRPYSKTCFLLNPITRARVNLPAWPMDRCLPFPAAFSSSPTDPNCFVVFMVSNEVVACRLDAHKPEWSITLTGEPHSYNCNAGRQFEMVGCNGDVYVLSDEGELGVVLGGGKEVGLTWLIDAPRQPAEAWGCHYYLLESCGEILMITRQGEYLAIYKADLVRKRWKRIRRVDVDRVFFLGHGSSFSASTAEMGGCGGLIYLLCQADEEEKYRDKMKVLKRYELVQGEGVMSWRKIAGSTKATIKRRTLYRFVPGHNITR